MRNRHVVPNSTAVRRQKPREVHARVRHTPGPETEFKDFRDESEDLLSGGGEQAYRRYDTEFDIRHHSSTALFVPRRHILKLVLTVQKDHGQREGREQSHIAPTPSEKSLLLVARICGLSFRGSLEVTRGRTPIRGLRRN